MIENAIASGISASATTRPASRSLRTLASQSWWKDFMCRYLHGSLVSALGGVALGGALRVRSSRAGQRHCARRGRRLTGLLRCNKKWTLSGPLELLAKIVPQHVLEFAQFAMGYADGNLIKS